MGFSFAVLFSIVNKKRRKPRLQDFRDKLQKKKINNVTLYQYPSKGLFFITVILLMGMCLEWFVVQLKSDIEIQQSSTKPKEKFIEAEISDVTISKSDSKKQKTIDVDNMSRVRQTINIIHFFEVCALAALLSSLKLRIVKTNKRNKFIQATNYSDFGLKKHIEHYQLKQGDKIQIWELGQTRFTNTNYYYSIRIVNSAHQWEIIRKSHIYGARTAVIQLGFVHSLPYSTKIIKMNNPQQQQRKNQ